MRDLSEKIRNRDGDVIKQSRNWRGIRDYVRDSRLLITCLSIDEIGSHEGKLMILFENGDSYETNFASFDMLRDFVRRWKNVHGAPLRVNGLASGMVSRSNPRLNAD